MEKNIDVDSVVNSPAEFFRVIEAAKILNYSKKHVERMLRSGKLPGIKIGRSWRIPREGLKVHLEHILRVVRGK